MGHLHYQRALPTVGPDELGLSRMAKKLRLLADHRVAVLNAPAGFSARLDLPATPLWVRRDVLGEITSVTGYRPVAFVAVDDDWTALRFKRA